MLAEFESQGITLSKEDWQRIHSPIGWILVPKLLMRLRFPFWPKFKASLPIAQADF